jgi:hypothetical protein
MLSLGMSGSVLIGFVGMLSLVEMRSTLTCTCLEIFLNGQYQRTVLHWKGKEYGDDDFFDYEDTQSCRSSTQE